MLQKAIRDEVSRYKNNIKARGRYNTRLLCSLLQIPGLDAPQNICKKLTLYFFVIVSHIKIIFSLISAAKFVPVEHLEITNPCMKELN